MELLVRNFNDDTLDNLMCRNLLSVNYDGGIFDCDFNQQLALDMMSVGAGGGGGVGEGGGEAQGKRLTVFDIDDLSDVQERKIRTDNHCYGCTAGRGSS